MAGISRLDVIVFVIVQNQKKINNMNEREYIKSLEEANKKLIELVESQQGVISRYEQIFIKFRDVHDKDLGKTESSKD